MAVDVSMVKPREGVMAVSLTPSTRTIFHPYVASPTTMPGAGHGQVHDCQDWGATGHESTHSKELHQTWGTTAELVWGLPGNGLCSTLFKRASSTWISVLVIDWEPCCCTGYTTAHTSSLCSCCMQTKQHGRAPPHVCACV